MRPSGLKPTGFTLIELLVVLSVIALLLTLVSPKYFSSVDKAKDAALRYDLHLMREALDKYTADTGKYPDSLNDLVAKGYLRVLPPDPVTDSTTTWITVPPKETSKGNVFNVRSGAPGKAQDGTLYADW